MQFNECFAIGTNAIESDDQWRRNHSISTIDSDDDNDDDSEEIVTFSALRTLQAAYRGAAYSVHYVDLNEEECGYFKLRDINCTDIVLSVKRSHILIDENTLSIKRMNVPATQQDDPVSEITNTERIYFSKFEPLVAKCEQNFFFVHENLKFEYEMLLKNTKQPMGTTIRVKKNRIIADRATNVLNALEPDVQLCAEHTLYVLKPDANDVDDENMMQMKKHRDDHEVWQRYIFNQDNELVVVESSLLYGGYCQEIFAVYNIVKERTIEEREAAHEEITDVRGTDDEDTSSESSSASSMDIELKTSVS